MPPENLGRELEADLGRPRVEVGDGLLDVSWTSPGKEHLGGGDGYRPRCAVQGRIFLDHRPVLVQGLFRVAGLHSNVS